VVKEIAHSPGKGKEMKEEITKTTVLVIDPWDLFKNPYLPRISIEYPEWIKCISLEVFGIKQKREGKP